MMKDPPRFDPYIDIRDGRLPGPSTYKPDDSGIRHVKSYSSAKSERMPTKYPETHGCGNYRLHSEFGVYSATDNLNSLNNVDILIGNMKRVRNDMRF